MVALEGGMEEESTVTCDGCTSLKLLYLKCCQSCTSENDIVAVSTTYDRSGYKKTRSELTAYKGHIRKVIPFFTNYLL